MEETKKCKCGDKKFLFLIVLILLVGGFFVWKNFGSKEEQKVAVEKSPIEVIDNGDGTKTVKNVEEGYEVTVPQDWKASEQHLVDEKISVENLGKNNQGDLELQDGSYMKLYVFENKNGFSIEDWAKNEWAYNNSDINIVNINGKNVLKTFSKVTFGLDDLQQKEDSGIIDFSFVNGDKVYSYTCIAAGLDYNLFLDKCEELVKQNIK